MQNRPRSGLRIVLIGKEGLFSSSVLNGIAANHSLIGVIESLPRNYGRSGDRGRLWQRVMKKKVERRDPQKSLQSASLQSGIPYLELSADRQNQMDEFLRALHPDVVCVATLSQLLTEDALSIPRLGTLNIHPSLLPKYRGPNPWFWQYHQMEKEGGVSVTLADQGADTGNILRQDRFSIPLGMDFSEMLQKVSAMGTTLLLEALEDLAMGKKGRAQRHLPCPLYARRVEADENLIGWADWPIERVFHVLKGAQRWIRPLPDQEGRKFGGLWKVAGFSKGTATGKPGSLVCDKSESYIVHPEGKIHLAAPVS